MNKRRVIDTIESLIGGKVRIVRPRQVSLLFEQIHLKRLFDAYEVDCVFDVGANRGQYAEMLRKKAGYKGLIVSYEPNPDALNVLQARAANDPNWQVVGGALSEVPGTQIFNVMVDDQFSSLHQPTTNEVSVQTIDKSNTVSKRVHVEALTLSQEFERISSKFHFKRPYLKMDTQGHDLAVIKGGASVLSKFIGLQSEMSFKRLYADAPDFTTALDFFQSCGFELSALVPNNEGHFPRLIEIDGIFLQKDLLNASPP